MSEEEIKEENLGGNSLLKEIVEVEKFHIKRIKEDEDYANLELIDLNNIFWKIAKKYNKLEKERKINYKNLELLYSKIRGLIVKRVSILIEKYYDNYDQFDTFGSFIQESPNSEEWLYHEIDFFEKVIKTYKDWKLAEYLNDLMVLSIIENYLSYLGAIYQKEDKGEENE
jgi:hypothetical protein